MAINDDELLAAVSGGVDAAAPVSAPAVETTPPEQETDNDDAGDSNVGADAPEGTETNAEGAAGEVGGNGDAGAKGEEDADGDATDPELDADGKPITKPEDSAEVDPATGKPYTPEALAAKKAEADRTAFHKQQVEDPINAPIPKYLKETTQKRMTKLVEIARDLTTKNETAQRDRNEILGMITDTGATAVQYTQALQYLKMVNSRDPVQIKQAISVMQGELSALSRMAGVPVAGVDHLANHADLKAAVEAKQITQALAEEIAAGREHRVMQEQNSQQTQQNTEEAQRAHAAGVQALNEVGRKLSVDPGYRTKAVAVLKAIGPDLQRQHPSQWAQTFLLAYTTYQPPRAAAPVVKKGSAVPKNQPLRGNNPSGGQQSAPKSLEEAINMGIAAGTRR